MGAARGSALLVVAAQKHPHGTYALSVITSSLPLPLAASIGGALQKSTISEKIGQMSRAIRLTRTPISVNVKGSLYSSPSYYWLPPLTVDFCVASALL